MKVIYVNGERFTRWTMKIIRSGRGPVMLFTFYSAEHPDSKLVYGTARIPVRPGRPDVPEAGFRHVAQSGRTFEVTEE